MSGGFWFSTAAPELFSAQLESLMELLELTTLIHNMAASPSLQVLGMSILQATPHLLEVELYNGFV
jgi:hypothetical protein